MLLSLQNTATLACYDAKIEIPDVVRIHLLSCDQICHMKCGKCTSAADAMEIRHSWCYNILTSGKPVIDDLVRGRWIDMLRSHPELDCDKVLTCAATRRQFDVFDVYCQLTGPTNEQLEAYADLSDTAIGLYCARRHSDPERVLIQTMNNNPNIAFDYIDQGAEVSFDVIQHAIKLGVGHIVNKGLERRYSDDLWAQSAHLAYHQHIADAIVSNVLKQKALMIGIHKQSMPVLAACRRLGIGTRHERKNARRVAKILGRTEIAEYIKNAMLAKPEEPSILARLFTSLSRS